MDKNYLFELANSIEDLSEEVAIIRRLDSDNSDKFEVIKELLMVMSKLEECNTNLCSSFHANYNE